MRKSGAAVAALVLALTGAVTSTTTTTAQATASGGCNSAWPGRNGHMYAWRDIYCVGLLGNTAGSDDHWGDAYGPFTGLDANNASSVMNAGYTGGRDVVKFFFVPQYEAASYACLDPTEYFADDLRDNTFTNGALVNDNIMAHKWVTDGECAWGSWIG
ncbi:hypothetical protein [Streptomyces sp. NPDC053755]|uniref:hypothetical protein n=1 Tax=Streptomyces sp. NPDC053755 TaxID=3155815 RepID=UPI00341C5BC4